MSLTRVETLVSSRFSSVCRAVSNSASSVGLVLVIVTRPPRFQPALFGVTPIRSSRASSTSRAPPRAGPIFSEETVLLPDSSSRASNKNSSASSIPRPYLLRPQLCVLS
jgi:hypothetical protein